MTKSVTHLIGEAGIAKPDVVLSGATGVADLADQEVEALCAALPNVKIRATGDMIGHAIEAVAPFGAALAAALCDAGAAKEVAISSVGHRFGEGVIRVIGI